MLPSTLRRVVFLLTALLLLSACKSSESKADPTPSTTPTDVSAIRDVDLTRQPAVTTLVSQFAGQVDVPAILYADVTSDGREDAAVPISSGGTLGNLAYVVFTMRSGSPAPVLTRTVDKTSRSGLRMEVVDGRLVETVAEYGPEDPLCCPTYLRKTYFRWDGSSLQVDKEERVPNPDGGQKN